MRAEIKSMPKMTIFEFDGSFWWVIWGHFKTSPVESIGFKILQRHSLKHSDMFCIPILLIKFTGALRFGGEKWHSIRPMSVLVLLDHMQTPLWKRMLLAGYAPGGALSLALALILVQFCHGAMAIFLQVDWVCIFIQSFASQYISRLP